MKRYPLFLLALLLISCIREVDLEVDDIPHLLVVNCFFTEGEAFKVNVSRLANYTDMTDRNIPNARVILSTGGNTSFSLPYQGKGIYSDSSLLPEPGKMYRISVEADGYPRATAHDSLPPPVPVDSVTYLPKAGKYEDGIDFNQYSVWFRDIPGKTCYCIQVLGKDDAGDKQMFSFEMFSTDPVISAEGVTGEEFRDWFVFSDTLISNRPYSLKINVGDYYDEVKQTRVLLISGTCPYYQYLKRLMKHESYSYQDPFKAYNPVPLYSNVENGLGVFAGFQARSYDVMISESNTSPPAPSP